MKIHTIAIASVAAVAVAGLCIGAYSHRDLITELTTHVKTVDFADRAAQDDYQSGTDLPTGSTSPREWMPLDATDIRISFVTTNGPGWNMRLTSRSGLTPELLRAGSCSPAPSTPKPAVESDWMPDTLPPVVYICASDSSYVGQTGASVYAWQGGAQ